jgi:hypothetical protein
VFPFWACVGYQEILRIHKMGNRRSNRPDGWSIMTEGSKPRRLFERSRKSPTVDDGAMVARPDFDGMMLINVLTSFLLEQRAKRKPKPRGKRWGRLCRRGKLGGGRRPHYASHPRLFPIVPSNETYFASASWDCSQQR